MGNSIHIVLFCGTLLYSNVCGTAVTSRHRSSFWNHHESSFHSIHIDSLFVHSVIPIIPSSTLSYFLSNTSILLQKMLTILQIVHTSKWGMIPVCCSAEILPATQYSIHHVIATHKQVIMLVNGSNRLPNHFISIPSPKNLHIPPTSHPNIDSLTILSSNWTFLHISTNYWISRNRTLITQTAYF